MYMLLILSTKFWMFMHIQGVSDIMQAIVNDNFWRHEDETLCVSVLVFHASNHFLYAKSSLEGSNSVFRHDKLICKLIRYVEVNIFFGHLT